MKVTVQRLKDNKVSLDIEVSGEAVKEKFDEVYDKIGKEVKVPGFRPGKAPRHVLEQHHSKLASEEVVKDLVSQTYQEGIKRESLDVIDVPQITDIKLTKDILSYKAEVELKPEIRIKQYKGIKLKKNEIEVQPSEIEEQVNSMKKSRDADISEDRLARSLGYKTKEEFRDCLYKQRYLQKENEEKARLERELINQLLKMSSFKAPDSLVQKRMRELEYQAENQMKSYGLSEDRIKERLEEFKVKLEAEAQEQVKIFLILEAIAKLENMKLDDHVISRVVEFLFAEAEWQ